jgi:hypothetical protein
VHLPAPSLVYPALQIQSESASLPAGASEFTVHAQQWPSDVAPLAAEYLPAPQSMHVLSDVAPNTAEYLPAPQPMHVLSAVAPLAVEYFPAAHFVHASLPLPALYVPAAHGVGVGAGVVVAMAVLVHVHGRARTRSRAGALFSANKSPPPLPSDDPTYTFAQSKLTTGEDRTAFPVENRHCSHPVAASSACILLS